MAQIRLTLYEAEGDLPDVCMRCGEPATTTRTKSLSWYPPWVNALVLLGLLPFAIVAMTMTRRARLQAPFCDRHQYHWLMRTLVSLGSLAVVGAAGLLAILLAANPRRDANMETLRGLACAGSGILFLGWLVLLVVLNYTSIRATEITDRDLTLAGVGEEFVDAVEESERPRRRRSRRYEEDEDEDEDRPRRARARREEDDGEFEEDRPRPRTRARREEDE